MSLAPSRFLPILWSLAANSSRELSLDHSGWGCGLEWYAFSTHSLRFPLLIALGSVLDVFVESAAIQGFDGCTSTNIVRG